MALKSYIYVVWALLRCFWLKLQYLYVLNSNL